MSELDLPFYNRRVYVEPHYGDLSIHFSADLRPDDEETTRKIIEILSYGATDAILALAGYSRDKRPSVCEGCDFMRTYTSLEGLRCLRTFDEGGLPVRVDPLGFCAWWVKRRTP